MPTILQKLRSGIAKADAYIQEHDLAAKLDPLATAGGFLIVLSLVVLGIWAVIAIPHVVIQRSLDAALSADRAKQLELEDTYRKTITQIVLGVFGLFLLYFTWRLSVAGDKTVRIAEQGHITDRFTKAIEQLGKMDGTVANIEVRLGAIYALERIAFDSPRDHWTIMEILTAYVRQNAPLDYQRPYTLGEKPRTDIQAILTVLGRRKTGPKRERPGQRLDLTKSHLCGANLYKANLQNADLKQANLLFANLSNSSLQNTLLELANLQNSFLEHANLQKADLLAANLREVNLSHSYLQEAVLAHADMQEVLLGYANLEDADLTEANLQRAVIIHANLRNSDLSSVNLQNGMLNESDLQNAEVWNANLQQIDGLTVDQIKSAHRWQTAHYSPTFRAELGLPSEPAEVSD